jgi:hypothetical protein
MDVIAPSHIDCQHLPVGTGFSDHCGPVAAAAFDVLAGVGVAGVSTRQAFASREPFVKVGNDQPVAYLGVDHGA